ncbi:MAG TPA: hypothetical protein VJI46_02775 [Candidatus Nanoarchaeia archaeon]|nr:hypothetical protein [Candidatus Nanoarchaeia archaeon]
MEIRNVEDCLNFRLLRKISPDKGKSQRSLDIAKARIKEAEKALQLKVYTYAIVEAYTASFILRVLCFIRMGYRKRAIMQFMSI